MSAPLYPTRPSREHRFPEKRHVRRVVAAKHPYECDTIGPKPPGHDRRIWVGDRYCRVQLRPDEPGRGHAGWRTRRFCRACAIHLGLATEGRP